MTIKFKFGTKAQTLRNISNAIKLSVVPAFITINYKKWQNRKEDCFIEIDKVFKKKLIIIRSSSKEEDTEMQSNAGLFESISNVNPKVHVDVKAAINKVFDSYRINKKKISLNSEIIIQEMLDNISMSGVIFTRDINSGAPYYIINYDDETGRTDSVTGGDYNNRSLLILRNSIDDLKSKRFISLINAVREIEIITSCDALDIEFATDKKNNVFIFQTRRISTTGKWKNDLSKRIYQEIKSIRAFLSSKIQKLNLVYGKKSIFGQMPDWNPVEMIGRNPRPLAISLYRYLITDEIWSRARSIMGYNAPFGLPLMSSFSGIPYIDCRASFNSLLPKNLPKKISETIVNNWIKKLEKNHHFHDKIEFEIVVAEFTFDFEKRFKNNIGSTLSKEDKNTFKNTLFALTKKLINGEVASIEDQLLKINHLEQKRKQINVNEVNDIHIVSGLLQDCKEYGTLPFSILARHGFIAKSLLQSLVNIGIISERDFYNFLSSIKTVAGELIDDADKFLSKKISYRNFMEKYGHLRPGTYDILSKRYDEISSLFKNKRKKTTSLEKPNFKLSLEKKNKIKRLLEKDKFGITVDQLFSYIEKSTRAREYAKFIFSKNISDALFCIEKIGLKLNMNKNQLSYLPYEKIFNLLIENNTPHDGSDLVNLSKINEEKHKINSSIHLPHMICNQEDVTIVPLLINRPNFITTKSASGEVIFLEQNMIKIPNISNKIILIESADPGYDWIFSRNIKALLTKYGGSNSHMSIRCAEFEIPAAIGCGEQIFERIKKYKELNIDCLTGEINPSISL